jgi:hypothetical protein
MQKHESRTQGPSSLPFIPHPPLGIHAVFGINMRQSAAKLLQGISRRTGETPSGLPFGLQPQRFKGRGNRFPAAPRTTVRLPYRRKSKNRPPRRYFRGHVNNQPVAGGNFNRLFDNHISEYSLKTGNPQRTYVYGFLEKCMLISSLTDGN